jgi:hypothetical protein
LEQTEEGVRWKDFEEFSSTSSDDSSSDGSQNSLRQAIAAVEGVRRNSLTLGTFGTDRGGGQMEGFGRVFLNIL